MKTIKYFYKKRDSLAFFIFNIILILTISNFYCRRELMENNVKYVVIPLHHRPDLVTDCCKLINSEWPRSETARCVP